MVQD
ncbi:hypothetical protein LINPERHAP2_LOCUS4056 [Linum perenne]